MLSCPNCHAQNPAQMNFCGQCGASLNPRCPNCGFENPPGFKFCGQCGSQLTINNDQLSNNNFSAPAERRQLTVMFCDLVGSTALSQRLDPEELREVIRAYQETAAQVIAQFEGYIAQYLGDGLLVYFGYPSAHEDDARRAVNTGLNIIRAMEQLVSLPVRLQIRIGIHTGLVVVGEVGSGAHKEQLALGETTNVAARLQGLATPNVVIISEATHRLAQGFFECRPLGPHRLKGISQPVQIFQVQSETQARSRLDVVASGGLVPLVGRDQELDLLLAGWSKTKLGQGQVGLLSGEAGIGKSRLVYALKEQVAGQPHLWLNCNGSAYHQNSALFPLIDLLQHQLDLHSRDTSSQKLAKLETILQRYQLPLAEILPLLAVLMSLPLPEPYTPLNLSPQRQKQKTVEALFNILRRLADTQPVLLVVEDLHWIDPSTLDMLNALTAQISRLRVMAVFTFRPGFESPWPRQPHLSHISLSRLSQNQVEQMVTHMAGSAPLPAHLFRQVVDKTDGVPIFVEELTKMVLEQELDQTTDTQLSIPTTLQDLLMARLDRLASAREVAQLGATVGREFSYALIRAIAPFGEAALQANLKQLVGADLLYQQGAPPQAVYTFKHALIQEAAYRSLLRKRRQDVHRQIAQTLVQQFPQIEQTEPELLAQHYTSARLYPQAIESWQQAGRQAATRSANVEAARHFQQALDLLDTLPESPERLARELQLRVALGGRLLMTQGYAAPEVEVHYARARHLCHQLESTPQLLPILYGLWLFHLLRAQYEAALEVGEQILRLAEAQPDSVWLLEAHQVQGTNFFYLGELILAREHLEQAVALYNPAIHAAQGVEEGGTDRGVACLAHLALTLWLLGYPEQALTRSEQAIALAKDLKHPYSIAFALCLGAWLHQYRRDEANALTQAQEAMTVCREQEFALLGAFAVIFEGWAITRQGQTGPGVTRILAGVAGFNATGAGLGQPHFLALLAEAHAGAGQFNEGLAVLNGALAAVRDRNERFYEAELYRLRGELLHHSGEAQDESAAQYFWQAINVARHQQAKSLELRATISLCKLWRRQGRALEGQQLLQQIYHQFSEGFETGDLQEAAQLLRE